MYSPLDQRSGQDTGVLRDTDGSEYLDKVKWEAVHTSGSSGKPYANGSLLAQALRPHRMLTGVYSPVCTPYTTVPKYGHDVILSHIIKNLMLGVRHDVRGQGPPAPIIDYRDGRSKLLPWPYLRCRTDVRGQRYLPELLTPRSCSERTPDVGRPAGAGTANSGRPAASGRLVPEGPGSAGVTLFLSSPVQPGSEAVVVTHESNLLRPSGTPVCAMSVSPEPGTTSSHRPEESTPAAVCLKKFNLSAILIVDSRNDIAWDSKFKNF